MSDSKHSMITRSKQKMMEINSPPPPSLPEEDIDEHGNVNDLIDYVMSSGMDPNYEITLNGQGTCNFDTVRYVF